MARTLQAPVTVAFDYTRSTGPVLGRFFSGLRDGVVVGGRTASGQVLVPPPEYDPDTHEQVTDFVDLSATGTVTSWSWCPEPVAGQPLDRPFAWVQVKLDGADGTLLHALDVASPDDVETGMRVQVRWAEKRTGVITDIACLEPVVEQRAPASVVETPEPEEPPVTGIIVPVELDYLYAASPEESAFYRALEEGRLIGQRCPVCQKVYVPPRSACPIDGVATTDEV